MGAELSSPACRYPVGAPARASGVPAIANPGDRTDLGILRLGGGLAEWTSDALAPYRAPCWRPEQPFLQDPRCAQSDEGLYAVRGASWAEPPGFVRTTARRGVPDGAKGSRLVGFRCALSRGGAP